MVRADALYGNVGNLSSLEELSLAYAIGIGTKLTAIKNSIKLFKKLAKNKSSKIIHIDSGHSNV